VRHGLNVVDELRQGVGEVEFMADARMAEVRLGCPETLAATLLPGVVERFSEQYPEEPPGTGGPGLRDRSAAKGREAENPGSLRTHGVAFLRQLPYQENRTPRLSAWLSVPPPTPPS
jgi:hypothetical protein